MSQRKHGLLPLTGEERALCNGLGLSDDFIRDLDMMLTTRLSTRTMLMTILRKLRRAGVRRHLSSPAPPSQNGPTSQAIAELNAAVARVAQGRHRSRIGLGRR